MQAQLGVLIPRQAVVVGTPAVDALRMKGESLQEWLRVSSAA